MCFFINIFIRFSTTDDFLFRIYESSLVFIVILGIVYYSILIYLKIKFGEKWKDGILYQRRFELGRSRFKPYW